MAHRVGGNIWEMKAAELKGARIAPGMYLMIPVDGLVEAGVVAMDLAKGMKLRRQEGVAAGDGREDQAPVSPGP